MRATSVTHIPLSPAARAELLRAAKAYRLTADGCEALMDAIADDADAATVRRRKRDREAKARKRAQTISNTPVPLVSQQPYTKTAPDAAYDNAEGLTTSAVGGRDS